MASPDFSLLTLLACVISTIHNTYIPLCKLKHLALNTLVATYHPVQTVIRHLEPFSQTLQN